MSKFIYPPREDSQLLVGYLEKQNLENKTVFEIGIGSGVLLQKLSNNSVKIGLVGVDINFYSALHCQNNLKKSQSNVGIIVGNGLRPLRKNISFELIVSNPPYLPADKEIDQFLTKEEKNALIGGRVGIEVLLGFLADMEIGSLGIFIISSNATKPEILSKIIFPNQLSVIKKRKLDFETLWLIKIVINKKIKAIFP